MKAKSRSDDKKIQDFSSLIKTLQENLADDKIKIRKMQEEQKKLMEDNKNLQSMNEELKESASCQASAACMLEKEVGQLKNQLIELSKEAQQKDKASNDLRETLMVGDSALDAQVSMKQVLVAETKSLDKNLERKEVEIMKMRCDQNKLQKSNEILTHEDLKMSQSSYIKAAFLLNEEVRHMKDKLESKDTEIITLSAEVTTMQNQLSDTEKNFNKVQNEIQQKIVDLNRDLNKQNVLLTLADKKLIEKVAEKEALLAEHRAVANQFRIEMKQKDLKIENLTKESVKIKMELQNASASSTWYETHAAVLESCIISSDAKTVEMLREYTELRNEMGDQKHELKSLVNEKTSLEQEISKWVSSFIVQLTELSEVT